MTLHLLRGFVQWERAGEPIKTIPEAEAWVKLIADPGFEHFYTWTSRRPRRAAELEGGSVCFVGGQKRRQSLFRMPFVGIEESAGGWAICMRPELIRVHQWPVGQVRGWRYLKDEDTPPDLRPVEIAGLDMPAEMVEDLKREGLL